MFDQSNKSVLKVTSLEFVSTNDSSIYGFPKQIPLHHSYKANHLEFEINPIVKEGITSHTYSLNDRHLFCLSSWNGMTFLGKMDENNLELANFNHSLPVINSVMDANNVVYSSTIDGKIHSIDFVKQTCNNDICGGDKTLRPGKIKYCHSLNTIISNPFDGSAFISYDIRNIHEGVTLPMHNASVFDINFPFMATCSGKTVKIYDMTRDKEIYSAEIIGVFGFITTVNFKNDPERGIILGTTGGQIILHNLVNFHFESNEYLSIFKSPSGYPQNHVYPVNSVDIIDNNYLFITGCNTCKVVNLKQSRELFQIKPKNSETTQICSFGAVNHDKSLFSFGMTTNLYQSVDTIGPPAKLGFYKLDDLKEMSRYGLSSAIFSIQDPENPITCDFDKNIRREIIVSEMSKMPNTNYFDMLKRRKASSNIVKQAYRFDLPNELVGKIIEYIETRHYPTISSVNRQFRECLFEKKSITIPLLFDRNFFTKFLNEFKNLQTITLKGEAVRCIKALTTKVKSNLKTLVVISPSTFLCPTIKTNWFFKGPNLESLIIYNCKKLKITSRYPNSSLKKLHIINCGIIGMFECYSSITDLDISGSNIDSPKLHTSLRKLKLSGNDNLDQFEHLHLITHLCLSVERVIPELTLPQSIQYLDISGCKIVKILPRLPNLTHLVMDRSDVKVDFENLGSLVHLSMKYICNTEPLAVVIRNKTLSSISIFGSNIESFNIDCPLLTYLNVGSTCIKDDQLGNCLNKHFGLKYLHTPDCIFIENPLKSVETILDSLCLWNSTRSTVDFSQVDLTKIPNIKIQC
ncbi:leucine rich repeat protein [Naegleria gruberi]|uniref:Leucine rich repeat protein n=1 Tax=Naegleria gruberi TaxID=5762 RepID=D2V474_NAEGR|nr:leucine rich repeat protein [Naegleria gruberi]EFC48469.1 leucine rich repeat protein [Naegleria gruberi]|eukprot:XP_002681213.1 leucine rich repeat protein [Naegleria gruberi strain NEG-M]